MSRKSANICKTAELLALWQALEGQNKKEFLRRLVSTSKLGSEEVLAQRPSLHRLADSSKIAIDR